LNGSRKIQVTDHFALGEDQLECSCCGAVLLTDLFWAHMELLERLRLMVGPCTVTSGHRCEKHNTGVGGALRSLHRDFATDIKNRDLDAAYDAAVTLGFAGIGRYNSFVHLDRRDLLGRPPASWDERSV
jgi:hypothetical protein